MDSTLQRDAFLPHRPPGMGRGLALAVLAHLLLVAALTFSVRWRASDPAGVEAELWSAVPQAAAPRAVEPLPTPPPPRPEPRPEPRPKPAPPAPVEPPAARIPDAQIAIEQAKKAEAARREEVRREDQRREQQRRAEAERKDAARQEAARKTEEREQVRRDAAEREQARDKQQAKQRELAEAERKKKEQAEVQRQAKALESQREVNLKRIAGMAGASGDAGATGLREKSSGPSANYAGRIIAKVKPNIVFADSVPGNPVATVEVRVATDGTITSRRIVKSSGEPAWDEAVLRAIDRTEVLPRDTDGRVPPSFAIEFRPRD